MSNSTVFVPAVPMSETMTLYGAIIVGYIALAIVSAVTMIYFLYDERKIRGSWRACINRFNILCTVVLFSCTCLMILMVFRLSYKSLVSSADVDMTINTLIPFDYLFNAPLLSGYIFYIFSRSDVLMWGSKIRKYLKGLVIAVIVLNGIIVIMTMASIRAYPKVYDIINGYTLSIVSILVGIIIVGLDIYYTRLFHRHVVESSSVFRSLVSDKDIVAHYGRTCSFVNLTASFLNFITLMVYYAGFNVTCRYIEFFYRGGIVFTAVWMAAMKMKLNSMASERSRNATAKGNTGATNSTAPSSIAGKKQVKSTAQASEASFDESRGTRSDTGAADISTNKNLGAQNMPSPMNGVDEEAQVGDVQTQAHIQTLLNSSTTESDNPQSHVQTQGQMATLIGSETTEDATSNMV